VKENVFRMVKKIKKESSLSPMGDKMGCCKVESIISIDERGQMVLPKELREKANIHPGDKLALICLEKKGKIYCFSLVKVEELTGMVKDLLGPMMKEMVETPLGR
jgi:AbrB family looped-hinge helix DNA binding protein